MHMCLINDSMTMARGGVEIHPMAYPSCLLSLIVQSIIFVLSPSIVVVPFLPCTGLAKRCDPA